MRKYLLRIPGSIALTGMLLAIPELCFAGPGAVIISDFIQLHIINQALIAFWGIAAAAVFYYGVRMIITSPAEGTYAEISNSFIHMFSGFAVIACTGAIVSALYHPGGDITPVDLTLGLGTVSKFIFNGSFGIFTLMATIAGIGMVTSGDESGFGKWRKIVTGNVFGIVIMLLANVIVTAILTSNASLVTTELAGMVSFMLTIVGFVAVLALIVAGILLIVSIDESLKERAKKIITGTLIAIALVVASFSLVRVFVS